MSIALKVTFRNINCIDSYGQFYFLLVMMLLLIMCNVYILRQNKIPSLFLILFKDNNSYFIFISYVYCKPYVWFWK